MLCFCLFQTNNLQYMYKKSHVVSNTNLSDYHLPVISTIIGSGEDMHSTEPKAAINKTKFNQNNNMTNYSFLADMRIIFYKSLWSSTTITGW